MSILELSTGETRTLPGPIRKLVLQSGQLIVVDPTTTPASTTTLNTDDTFDGAGKAGLRLLDAGDGGCRVYYESTLEDENRVPQNVAPDARPTTDPQGEPLTPDQAQVHSDEPVPTTVVPNAPQRGDSDGDSPTGGTGSYEDRTVAELKATAKKNGVDLEGAKTKAEIIEKLRA